MKKQVSTSKTVHTAHGSSTIRTRENIETTHKVISVVRIVKNSYGEYVCKAYDQCNTRLPDCDYYTPDFQNAKDTMKAMLKGTFHVPSELD